jgi:hypothetical protein
VGIQWTYGKREFFGGDAKLFQGLQKIVVLVEQRKQKYEMHLVPIPDTAITSPEPDPNHVSLWMHWFEKDRALAYARCLRRSIEEKSKKWKQYQKRREKQDKSNPDWMEPTVRVAKMEIIRHIASPYLYEHSFHYSPGVLSTS